MGARDVSVVRCVGEVWGRQGRTVKCSLPRAMLCVHSPSTTFLTLCDPAERGWTLVSPPGCPSAACWHGSSSRLGNLICLGSSWLLLTGPPAFLLGSFPHEVLVADAIDIPVLHTPPGSCPAALDTGPGSFPKHRARTQAWMVLQTASSVLGWLVMAF